MTEIFLKLVNMSISAGWLILAVLVLRLVLQKAPKAVRCILWCLVGWKLMIPFSVESVFSLIPSSHVISRETLYAAKPVIDSGVSVLNQALNPILAEHFAPNPGDSVNPLQVWAAVASVVWVVGMAVLLLYTLCSYFHLKSKVKGAVQLQDNIYQSETVASPFILGLIRPRIFLPFFLKEEERSCVLAHEKAHIKRGDHLWKPLGFLILSVYWFQPLVWIAYILLCRDIELACDEKVMKQIGEENKKTYSHALLNCSISHRSIAACPLAFGEVGVRQRIKNVLNYKKPTFWIVALSGVACVVCAICFWTEPKEEQKENNLQSEIADFSPDGEVPEILQSPPTLILRDSLSASMNAFEVRDVGTYSWYYKNGDMMNGAEACGPEPQRAVKDKEWLKLASYNKLDYVPYVFEFSMEPDEITILEYGLSSIDIMGAKAISETVYRENYATIPLKSGRIYEVIAVWDEEKLDDYGCYGTAYYAFATESDAESGINESLQELTLGEVFAEDVNQFDGVRMTMVKYEATGGKVEIYNDRDKEIQYGEYFDIQVLNEGRWYSLQVPEGIAYNSIAYGVPPKGTGVWETRWEYIYGELPPGNYRMVKDIMDWREPGDFDSYYLAAEFEIK